MSQEAIRQNVISQDVIEGDETSVPRLDLAPKLKRPLSLWNPLDYLRLLYWVFFFPQALQWYVDTFGDGFRFDPEMTWLKAWKLLPQNPILRQFLLQSLVLTVITSVLGWSIGFSLKVGVAYELLFAVIFGSFFRWLFSLEVAWTTDIECIEWFSWTSEISEMSSAVKLRLSVLAGVLFSLALLLSGIASLLYAVLLSLAVGLIVSVLVFVFFSVMLAVATLRPENWLLFLPFILLKPLNEWWQLPRVTPIPTPLLSSRLKNWLERDWEMGLYNVNQLLTYTLQFIPVVQVINQVLAETPPELVMSRVAQLAETPYGWTLVRFASASLTEEIKSLAANSFFFLPQWQRQRQAVFVTETRLNTPARAAAAGFWYLYLKEPEKATDRFAEPSLPYL